jgi:hypothetical protein
MLTPPEIIPIDLNNFKNAEKHLYDEIYIKLLTRKRYLWLGKPVVMRRNPPDKYGRPRTFSHLISEGPVGEDDRTPDIRRCERLHWIDFILDHVNDRVSIRCWKNIRKAKNGVEVERTILWLWEYDYVVVLEERAEFVLLKTAYFVEQEHRKENLEKEWGSASDPREI